MERPDFLPLEKPPDLAQIMSTGVYLLGLEVNLQRDLTLKEYCFEIVGVEEPTRQQKQLVSAVGGGLSKLLRNVKTRDQEKLIAIIKMRQSELNLL
jgi:hypothetical protein